MLSSGLGQGPNGEILASETWWQANTKVTDSVVSQINLVVTFEHVLMTFSLTFQGRTECYKVFKDQVPPYLDDLMLVFDQVTVDGTSAFCPGYEETDDQPNKGKGVARDIHDLTVEDDPYSPMSTGPNRPTSSAGSKRASSTATTGESPTKKTKSPMVKALRGLVAEIKIDREEGKKKEYNYAKREEARTWALVNAQAQIMEHKRQAIQAEMDECVTLAKECGVAEASIEMWVASELFMDGNKRAFF